MHIYYIVPRISPAFFRPLMRLQLGLLSPAAVEARSVVCCTDATDIYHAKMGHMTLQDGPCATCHQVRFTAPASPAKCYMQLPPIDRPG